MAERSYAEIREELKQGIMAGASRIDLAHELKIPLYLVYEIAGRPFYNPLCGLRDGFVAGDCGHAVAFTEWIGGFRNCERC